MRRLVNRVASEIPGTAAQPGTTVVDPSIEASPART
jgi:hypothetical protein